jgi:predicted  nucleic acid-binding Zn-ribbon protein
MIKYQTNMQELLRQVRYKNKQIEEKLDPSKKDEYDGEGSMAKSQLKTAQRAIDTLMSLIDDNTNLPEWVQSKITKSADYLDSVRDYMESEGTVTEEEDPKADNRAVQLDKQIAQVKSRIAALQQTLDTLQDRKQGA